MYFQNEGISFHVSSVPKSLYACLVIPCPAESPMLSCVHITAGQLGIGVAWAQGCCGCLSVPRTRLGTLSLFGQMVLGQGRTEFQMVIPGCVHIEKLFGLSQQTVFGHSVHGQDTLMSQLLVCVGVGSMVFLLLRARLGSMWYHSLTMSRYPHQSGQA